MFRQWLTLVIIVLVYIPVAIDATVLHVAAPTLSMTLGASGNELLWIIDIYSWSWLAWCCRWAHLAIVSV
ncbi:methyl viologen resistance protein SmvA [Salmonella enterica subsp. enterica serovar Tallahassee str. 0012]|nr:methyl viologen resistance protein SmvA [Salmonella enterica subsp. enterica serovar Tallahassee str. 0012]